MVQLEQQKPANSNHYNLRRLSIEAAVFIACNSAQSTCIRLLFRESHLLLYFVL